MLGAQCVIISRFFTGFTGIAQKAHHISALVAVTGAARISGNSYITTAVFAVVRSFQLLLADAFLVIINSLAPLPSAAAFIKQHSANITACTPDAAHLLNKLLHARHAARVGPAQGADVRLNNLAVIHFCHGKNYAGVNIRQRRFDRIAAFQNGNIRL